MNRYSKAPTALLTAACALLLTSTALSSQQQAPVTFNPWVQSTQEFVVIIHTFNNAAHAKKNLKSIVHQKATNPYQIICINDGSTDNTGAVIDAYVNEQQLQGRVTVIHNKERRGLLENVMHHTAALPDNKIVVLNDGAFFFSHDEVLLYLEKQYTEGAWLAYSQGLRIPSNTYVGTEISPKLLKKKIIDRATFVAPAFFSCKVKLLRKLTSDSLKNQGIFIQERAQEELTLTLLEAAAKIGKKKIVNLNKIQCIYKENGKEHKNGHGEALSNESPETYKDQSNAPEFVILIASYNNQKYAKKNLKSVCFQKSSRPYTVIVVNDCSKDKTQEILETFVKEHHLESRVTIIHNTERIGAVANIYNTIHRHIPDNAVVVSVDGDDKLAHNEVLLELEKAYSNHHIWMTYGTSLKLPNGSFFFRQELPRSVLLGRKVRGHRFLTQHLRTFKAGLFKKIKKEDLMHEGKFLSMTGDLAWMLAMVEMAAPKDKNSPSHIAYIDKILYLYRADNPLNDFRIDRAYQRSLEKLIRKVLGIKTSF